MSPGVYPPESRLLTLASADPGSSDFRGATVAWRVLNNR